jgi:hypothetical protein
MASSQPDQCPTEKYLRYEPYRDTVFILGAGTSHPDGVPLQEHILPMIDSAKQSKSSLN